MNRWPAGRFEVKGKPKRLLFSAFECFLGSIGLFVAFYYVQQAGINRMREAEKSYSF